MNSTKSDFTLYAKVWAWPCSTWPASSEKTPRQIIVTQDLMLTIHSSDLKCLHNKRFTHHLLNHNSWHEALGLLAFFNICAMGIPRKNAHVPTVCSVLNRAYHECVPCTHHCDSHGFLFCSTPPVSGPLTGRKHERIFSVGLSP